MTSHDELVDAGAQAMHFLFVMPGTATNRGYAAAVVDAVEPLIRADERDTATSVAAEMMNEAWTNLAAKVEALPGYMKDRVYRADVLALLRGGSE